MAGPLSLPHAGRGPAGEDGAEMPGENAFPEPDLMSLPASLLAAMRRSLRRGEFSHSSLGRPDRVDLWIRGPKGDQGFCDDHPVTQTLRVGDVLLWARCRCPAGERNALACSAAEARWRSSGWR